MPPSLPFGKGMYILCHCMVEVCSLLFDFTRDYNEDSALIVRRDLEPCADTGKEYRDLLRLD